jgi:hypothetical protein
VQGLARRGAASIRVDWNKNTNEIIKRTRMIEIFPGRIRTVFRHAKHGMLACSAGAKYYPILYCSLANQNCLCKICGDSAGRIYQQLEILEKLDFVKVARKSSPTTIKISDAKSRFCRGHVSPNLPPCLNQPNCLI